MKKIRIRIATREWNPAIDVRFWPVPADRNRYVNVCFESVGRSKKLNSRCSQAVVWKILSSTNSAGFSGVKRNKR